MGGRRTGSGGRAEGRADLQVSCAVNGRMETTAEQFVKKVRANAVVVINVVLVIETLRNRTDIRTASRRMTETRSERSNSYRAYHQHHSESI